jgi:hypothetical protein
MSLFISQLGPYTLDVEITLLLIANGEGLNEVPDPSDPDVVQVTYTPPVPATDFNAVQEMLDSIINIEYVNRIVVVGVKSNFVLPLDPSIVNKRIDHNGAAITLKPGTLHNPTNDILIYIDVEMCNDQGYHVVDTSVPARIIDQPIDVILYHEFAHAFRLANDDPEWAAEDLAEMDENQYRKLRSPALPPRNVNNHYGNCGSPPGTPKPPQACFIVSAAYGSPYAAQVALLHHVRDVFLRRTVWGATFFQQLAAEYYQCAPQIAADMENSASLKALLTKLTVEPLLDFLTLAESYVIEGGWRNRRFGDRVKEVLLDFLASLPEVGFHRGQVEFFTCEVIQLEERLNGRWYGGDVRAQFVKSSGCPEALETLDYLVDVVGKSVPTTHYFAWALLTPLRMFWSLLTRLNNLEGEEARIGNFFAEAIEQWLGSVPLPPDYARLSAEAVQEDLIQLAGGAFALPSVQKQVGRRLLEGYGTLVPFDLEAVLHQAGYLPSSLKTKEACDA